MEDNQEKKEHFIKKHIKEIIILILISVISFTLPFLYVLNKNPKNISNAKTVSVATSKYKKEGLIYIKNKAKFNLGFILKEKGLLVTSNNLDLTEEIIGYTNSNSLQETSSLIFPTQYNDLGILFLKISKSNIYETSSLNINLLSKGDGLDILTAVDDKKLSTEKATILDVITENNKTLYKIDKVVKVGSLAFDKNNNPSGICISLNVKNEKTDLVLCCSNISKVLNTITEKNNEFGK